MTIKDMHYDLKKKLNKVDSEKYRNLLVPEIDWALNEAQELFVKIILQPKLKDYLGSQITQRTLDDIRTIIRHELDEENCMNVINNVSELPYDYWYYLSSFVRMSKGVCQNVEGKVFIRQHDDEFERSSNDFSSFEWRTVNAVFIDKGVRFYTNGFTIEKFCLSYIKRLNYIHNAEDFRDGKYDLPSGQILGEVSGGGTILVLSAASQSGSITVDISDGVNTSNLIIPFLIGDQIKTIVSKIVKEINNNTVFEAYRSNSNANQINIGGADPVTVVTFTDTDTTGIITSTSQNTTIGEGSLDCELPQHTHREIVDLAAMFLTGEMGNAPDYQFKQDKVGLNLNKK